MILEKQNYECRQETVGIVASERFYVKLPKQNSAWDPRDTAIIRTVARKLWIEWRSKAERKVGIMTSRS
jgi:hypothetical protein